MTDISIHALLAESDNSSYGALDGASISIHALLAESDNECTSLAPKPKTFLSTLSLRRATKNRTSPSTRIYNFYPRSPCGERPDTLTDDVSTGGFLSTLSLRRATLLPVLQICPPRDFYPRSPCGERPFLPYLSMETFCISIHALLAESDNQRFETQMGEFLFLSTLSLRRATVSFA